MIIVIYCSKHKNVNTGDQELDKLVPVSQSLKDVLTQNGEFLTGNCYLNPPTGTLWKKNPDGTLTEITKDPERVLTALKYYRINIENARVRCRAGRKDWFRLPDDKK